MIDSLSDPYWRGVSLLFLACRGVRVGLSGWTAPAVPYDIPQATGGAAFGITFMWPAPVPAAAGPPAPEAGGQR